ncbi:MAG: DUF3024 domain-containing protein [Solirubrobacterales bacterium]|nr:DUF3024 domain-containing protein [Solirubrobacterales bacterium]
MPLPEHDVEKLRDFCQARVPDRALDQVRVELELSPGAATIVEVRAPWREDYGPDWTRSALARLRYTMRTGVWTLYSRNFRGPIDPPKFRRYPFVGPSAKIEVLIEEIERDPMCAFWG